MKLHASLIAAACALALSACGGESPQTADTATPAPAPTTPADTAPATTTPAGTAPVDGSTPATGTDPGMVDPTASAAGAGAGAGTTDAATTTGAATGGEAAVTGCSVAIEGNDMMKYNVSSITVPSSCSEFTITLTHTGQLPVAAMGHNVVITAASDMGGVAADGIAAGVSAGYVKAGDDRVIAATDMIGGGETTSVTFNVDRISDGGPYEFFCSFPGHAALMKGTIRVG